MIDEDVHLAGRILVRRFEEPHGGGPRLGKYLGSHDCMGPGVTGLWPAHHHGVGCRRWRELHDMINDPFVGGEARCS